MSQGNNSHNGNKQHDQGNDSGPTPLSRSDDYVNFNETYDSCIEVRNSMPPPPNPNRDGGQKEE